MFEHVEPFGGDPILSLNEDFQKDPRRHKINLSIGIYFDDQGKIPVLDSVRRAEQQVVAGPGVVGPAQVAQGNSGQPLQLALQPRLFSVQMSGYCLWSRKD